MRGGVEPHLVHDLVRAMLLGGLSPDEVQEMFDRLPLGFGHRSMEDDPYRVLARAELFEARGDHEAALVDYDAAIARAGDQVRPAALGTAHVGAGRTLVALKRMDEAKEHAAIAA